VPGSGGKHRLVLEEARQTVPPTQLYGLLGAHVARHTAATQVSPVAQAYTSVGGTTPQVWLTPATWSAHAHTALVATVPTHVAQAGAARLQLS
jgi:hypothetical protein